MILVLEIIEYFQFYDQYNYFELAPQFMPIYGRLLTDYFYL